MGMPSGIGNLRLAPASVNPKTQSLNGSGRRPEMFGRIPVLSQGVPRQRFHGRIEGLDRSKGLSERQKRPRMSSSPAKSGLGVYVCCDSEMFGRYRPTSFLRDPRMPVV